MPKMHSRKIKSILDHVNRISTETQHNSMKAEDVLNGLEDREARRARRTDATDPRTVLAQDHR
jgi:hypothetical protein